MEERAAIEYVKEGLYWNNAPFDSVKWDVDVDTGDDLILVSCSSPKNARACARALQNSDEINEVRITGSFVEVT